jgi:Xaa-Pro dipeptidase
MSLSATHRARLERVEHNMEERGLTQLVVTDPSATRWLTGFGVQAGERLFALVLRAGNDPLFVVNDLFPTPDDLGVQVVGHRDTDDAVEVLARLLDPAQPLGVDKFMAAQFLLPLRDRGAVADLALGSPAVDDARSVKDPAELELMRRASALNDEAMAWLPAQLAEGATERAIAQALLGEYRRLGAQGFSFDPIVSFGAHAADPHHEPDDTVLAPGDAVLFDVGCELDGYCSDMTRTFFWKSCSDEQRRVYELVRAANKAAAAAVTPGVPLSQIDRAGRAVIEQGGYGHAFTHRLGHQIGTCVHEPGDVSATNPTPARPGMCFSDEPGIYLPGRFGVRIEDLICVTEDGREVLNHYPHDLVVLG